MNASSRLEPSPSVPLVVWYVTDSSVSLDQLHPHVSYRVKHIHPNEVDLGDRESMATALQKIGAIILEWGDATHQALITLRTTTRDLRIPVFVLGEDDPVDEITAMRLGATAFLKVPWSWSRMRAHFQAFHRQFRSENDPHGNNGRNGATSATDSASPRADGVDQEASDAVQARADSAPTLEALQARGHDAMKVGRFLLDRTGKRFWIDDDAIRLTKLEFGLMALFLSAPGTCFSHEVILQRVWDTDFDPGTSVVEQRVKKLREKLCPHGLGRAICTIRGEGYRLDM